MKYIFVALAAVIWGSATAAPPFQPETVESVKGKVVQASTNTARLKISAVIIGLTKPESINLGMISVCSTTACYRVNAPPATLDVDGTGAGTSAVVSELTVPKARISSIHIDELPGSNVSGSLVNLSGPLDLTQSSIGGEILVVIEKRREKKGTQFSISSAASGLLREHGKSIYYHPSAATTAVLTDGVEVSIPAGATQAPHIFNVAVLNTGDKYPIVDIFPVVRLRQSAEIIFRPSKGASQLSMGTESPTQKITFSETGVLRANNIERPSSSSTSTSTQTAADQQCVELLTQHNLPLLQAMGTTGIVYTNLCADKPPYVHIAIANKNFNGGSQLNLYHGPRDVLGPSPNKRPWIELKKITSYGITHGSAVLINGFTWEGDPGVVANNQGLALGYVEQSYNILGLNRVGGGANPADASDSQKRGMIWVRGCEPAWGTGADLPLFNGYCNYMQPWIIVSSSTSIVQDGNCSTDDLRKPWTAFGTTGSGLFVFMSSASGTSTTAAEMCGALKALGGLNAIRMDGNTAAGMMIDGIHKNPLTGTDSFIFGTARHIAYSIGFAAGATIVGPTPTYALSPTVNPPRDPCKLRPWLCSL